MDATLTADERRVEKGKLLKVLGVGFGLAICIGSTIGVGILRSPGPVAELLSSPWMIMLVWTLGGVYALFNANYVAELASMVPRAGGMYAYAQRAYGGYGGFVVGWCDWLNNTFAVSYISVVFGEYASGLFAPNIAGGRVFFSLLVVLTMTLLNALGVRSGSGTQKIVSALKALALLAFVVLCFTIGGQPSSAGQNVTNAAANTTAGLGASLVAFVLAFQLVIGAYDGWYSPAYFSEEDTNPARNLPRSLFGGTALIMVIYLLVNLAFLYVLPMSQLAGSKFAGADAMNVLLGERGGQVVTVLALVSLIGIINAILMGAPRILFALGREGLFFKEATKVSKGGTPIVGLLLTAGCAVILTTIGTFELLLAIGQFLILFALILLVVSVFILRRREPETPRPFRTIGYPFVPLLMLLFAVLLLVGYTVSNPFPSACAIVVLIISYPIFRSMRSNAAKHE
ncbi:MAG: APC family permease [Pyrinomonadaceae bacterium]